MRKPRPGAHTKKQRKNEKEGPLEKRFYSHARYAATYSAHFLARKRSILLTYESADHNGNISTGHWGARYVRP